MADTGFLRSRIEAEIRDAEARLADLREKLAVVEAAERLSQEYAPPPADTPQEPTPIPETIADAAFIALTAMGGQGHGRDILERVLAIKPIGGENQMTTLSAAMERDERFEKVGRNVWRLVDGN